MKLWPALVFLGACSAAKPLPVATRPPAPAAASIHGHLHGAAGGPPRFAQVRLTTVTGALLAETTARPDGSFELPPPSSADRVLRLVATAVDHRPSRALLANDRTDVGIDIQLGTYARPAKHAPMIALQPRGAELADPSPMKEQSDGTFVYDADIANGAYEYQISERAFDRFVNGSEPTTWRRDSSGDYVSAVTVTTGHVHVVLDYAKLPPAGIVGRTTFATPGTTSATLTRIDDRMHRLAEDRNDVLHPTANGADLDTKALSATMTALGADAHRDVGRELAGTSGIAETVGSLAFLATGREPADAERARRLRASLTPADPLWALYSNAFTAVDALAPDPAYADAFVHDHPDVNAVTSYLMSQLHRRDDDPAHHAKIVAALSEPRFAATPAGMLARRADGNRALAAGKPMPSFAFATIPSRPGEPKAKVTDKSFAGKVYLVDVWATWCVPCKAALPKLKEIHAKYKNRKNFAFLSVSIDEEPDAVVKFRAEHPDAMPWANAAAKQTEVAALAGLPAVAVPMMVLVDTHGTIVASSPDLDEASLETHLERLLAAK